MLRARVRCSPEHPRPVTDVSAMKPRFFSSACFGLLEDENCLQQSSTSRWSFFDRTPLFTCSLADGEVD
ncbi:hypothetical protein VTO42DRAFT_4604 [Malbranchea cinnamomea]